MFIRRHEYTPIAQVVLGFILTADDFRLCADTATTVIEAVIIFMLFTWAVVWKILPTMAEMSAVAMSAQRGKSRVVEIQAKTARALGMCERHVWPKT